MNTTEKIDRFKDGLNVPGHYSLEDGTDAMDHLLAFMGEELFKGFLIGNVYKYLLRHEKKNGVEDLHKAIDYIKRLVALELKR